MIQDIFPHQYHVEFRTPVPLAEDRLLIYRGNSVLSAPGKLELPGGRTFRRFPAATPSLSMKSICFWRRARRKTSAGAMSPLRNSETWSPGHGPSPAP